MTQVTNLNDKTQFYASDELLELLKSKIQPDDFIVNFAYTDYGGTFFDKVCISFFTEKYAGNTIKEAAAYDGENCFVFGEVAKEFLETTERYILGFDCLEEYYSIQESNMEYEDLKYFIDHLDTDKYEVSEGAIDQLCEKRRGYYNVLTTGLDYSERDLIKYCIDEKIITKKVN